MLDVGVLLSYDYLFSCLKPVFRYTISICICVGRKRMINGYCLVEKKGVKCAYFRFLIHKLVISIFLELKCTYNINKDPFCLNLMCNKDIKK